MLVTPIYLVPHRPTLVLDQHRGHRTPMLAALAAACSTLGAAAPQAIVALSARWGASGPFRVDAGRRHRTLTDYTGLGVEVRYDCEGHPALARALVEAGQRARLRVAATVRGVDSGVSVPLHFLAPARQVAVVPLSLPPEEAQACRTWGATLRAALERWSERVAFVVGGVLSCNEHAWNLHREMPEATEFDQRLLAALERGEWDQLRSGRRGRLGKARPEARLRHLDVLRGFLGEGTRGVVRCYEGGQGIGAALVEFEAPAPAPAPAGKA
jgi:aromatic ring-opening dioxygenase catalytic subunit (LigB family)